MTECDENQTFFIEGSPDMRLMPRDHSAAARERPGQQERKQQQQPKERCRPCLGAFARGTRALQQKWMSSLATP
jgi:hypothetical protein